MGNKEGNRRWSRSRTPPRVPKVQLLKQTAKLKGKTNTGREPQPWGGRGGRTVTSVRTSSGVGPLNSSTKSGGQASAKGKQHENRRSGQFGGVENLKMPEEGGGRKGQTRTKKKERSLVLRKQKGKG